MQHNDRRHCPPRRATNVSGNPLSEGDGLFPASTHSWADICCDGDLPCRRFGSGHGRSASGAMKWRLGLSRIEVIVILGIAAALLVIFLVVLGRSRESSRRDRCRANLVLIGKGLWSYVSGSEIEYPIAGPTSTANATPTPVTYFNMTGRHGGAVTAGGLGSRPSGHYWSELSTTRSLWLLMKSSPVGLSASDFVCPSSSDNPDTVGDPATFWDFPAKPGDRNADRGWEPVKNNETCVSYGYQVPYGRKGRASTEVEAGTAIAADKGPYGGVSLNNSEVIAPPANLTAEAASARWKPFNSPNHGGLMTGDGQNVLFGDLHVEFANTPITGIGKDNIYTRWTPQGDQAEPVTRLHGDRPGQTDPFNALTPAAETDSLIYP